MAHVNGLDKNDLAQILYKAAATPAKNLFEWKTKLPLLTLLISRGCVLRALRLTIQLSYNVTPDHIRIIALEILKLDRVDWQHINSLAFTFATWTLYLPDKPGSQDDKTVTDVARTAQYFAQNLRNVVESQGYITLPIACIPRNIRVLELTLDSSAAHVLPSICGETLKVLKLDEVPRNFAWHHFRYDIFDHPTIFDQLTVLHLSYDNNDMPLTEGEVQDKIALGTHNCNQLCFPALSELTIENCTPDCDLYTPIFCFTS
ncbi:hypothetical protein H4S03_005062 [Coemansia sp. S3946]|nr:hypothetical protein H4S03_005062 [Coemansia sp. S3946]